MPQVEVTPVALERLVKLPRVIQTRVKKILLRLEDWPDVSGAKPLRGNLSGLFRMRTGDYRILFRVDGDIVCVERIGHRSKFYEDD